MPASASVPPVHTSEMLHAQRENSCHAVQCYSWVTVLIINPCFTTSFIGPIRRIFFLVHARKNREWYKLYFCFFHGPVYLCNLKGYGPPRPDNGLSEPDLDLAQPKPKAPAPARTGAKHQQRCASSIPIFIKLGMCMHNEHCLRRKKRSTKGFSLGEAFSTVLEARRQVRSFQRSQREVKQVLFCPTRFFLCWQVSVACFLCIICAKASRWFVLSLVH